MIVNLTYVDDGRVLDTPEDLTSAFEHAIQTEVALKGYDMAVEIVLSCMKDGQVMTVGAEAEEDDEEMGCTCGSEELHGLGYHAHEIECMLIWVPMIQEAVALLGACPVRPQLEVIRTENCHPEEDYHRVIASWEEEDRKFTTILLDELSQDQAHEAIRDIQSRTVRIQAPCAST